MLTPDQQRVNDLLRETITLLCKNGLHFQSEFQIDGLIGITLDRQEVFLVTLNETVHLGDVFIRDSKKRPTNNERTHYNEASRKRSTDHQPSMQSKKLNIDNTNRHSEIRHRKNLAPIRIEPTRSLKQEKNDASKATKVNEEIKNKAKEPGKTDNVNNPTVSVLSESNEKVETHDNANPGGVRDDGDATGGLAGSEGGADCREVGQLIEPMATDDKKEGGGVSGNDDVKSSTANNDDSNAADDDGTADQDDAVYNDNLNESNENLIDGDDGGNDDDDDDDDKLNLDQSFDQYNDDDNDDDNANNDLATDNLDDDEDNDAPYNDYRNMKASSDLQNDVLDNDDEDEDDNILANDNDNVNDNEYIRARSRHLQQHQQQQSQQQQQQHYRPTSYADGYNDGRKDRNKMRSLSSSSLVNYDNDEEPVVVKIEPPDTYQHHQSSRNYDDHHHHQQQQHHQQNRPNNNNNNHQQQQHDKWMPGESPRHRNNSSNMIGRSLGGSGAGVGAVINNSPVAIFRNSGKTSYAQNNATTFTQSISTNNNSARNDNNNNSSNNNNNNIHLQQLRQQQRNSNNISDLYSQLVDITSSQGFHGEDFSLACNNNNNNDFMNMTPQQFSQQQQINRLLQRRQRSTFSKSQVKCLEDVFKTVHYVDAGLRMKLSRQLNLSEGTINIWFQNRRQKLKKQQQLHQQIQMSMGSGGPSNHLAGGSNMDDSIFLGEELHPSNDNNMGRSNMILSPSRPSNSSFSGSNAGSSPTYLQSPIHHSSSNNNNNNMMQPSSHSLYNAIDSGFNFDGSDSGKT